MVVWASILSIKYKHKPRISELISSSGNTRDLFLTEEMVDTKLSIYIYMLYQY